MTAPVVAAPFSVRTLRKCEGTRKACPFLRCIRRYITRNMNNRSHNQITGNIKILGSWTATIVNQMKELGQPNSTPVSTHSLTSTLE